MYSFYEDFFWRNKINCLTLQKSFKLNTDPTPAPPLQGRGVPADSMAVAAPSLVVMGSACG